MNKKVRISLYGLRKRGVVERVGKANTAGVKWKIAQPKIQVKTEGKKKAGKRGAPRLKIV